MASVCPRLFPHLAHPPPAIAVRVHDMGEVCRMLEVFLKW